MYKNLSISAFAICLLFCSVAYCFAKIITIPGDAQTVQEAVERAVNGDEIHLTTKNVYWTNFEDTVENGSAGYDPNGVVIENKDIKIIGMEPYSGIRKLGVSEFSDESSFIKVVNSHVTIENFRVEDPLKGIVVFTGASGGPVVSPIRIESGTLNIQDCYLKTLIECKGNLRITNSTILGVSWLNAIPYSSRTRLNPTLRIASTQDIEIQVINSTITSDHPDGYRNIAVENVRNSSFHFENSFLKGSTFKVGYGATPNQYIYGSDAIQFFSCQDIHISLQKITIFGGNGYPARGHRHNIIQGGGNGGDAVSLVNTTAQLLFNGASNLLTGGTGGNGLLYQYPAPFDPDQHLFHAGNGGHGLALYDSTIMANYAPNNERIKLNGGAGGEGQAAEEWSNGFSAKPGLPGKGLYIDENSELITLSSVINWNLY